MHIEAETHTQTFTSRKKNTFFHVKVSKTNITIHIDLYFVNSKKKKQKTLLQPSGPSILFGPLLALKRKNPLHILFRRLLAGLLLCIRC